MTFAEFAQKAGVWDAKNIDKTTFDLSAKNPNGGDDIAPSQPGKKILEENRRA